MKSEVIDSFNIKGRVAVEYGVIGVVVIFKLDESGEPPFPGDRILLIRPDGWIRSAVIGEVKLADGAPGFFVGGLGKHEVPVGTKLFWGADVSPASLEGMVLTSVH